MYICIVYKKIKTCDVVAKIIILALTFDFHCSLRLSVIHSNGLSFPFSTNFVILLSLCYSPTKDSTNMYFLKLLLPVWTEETCFFSSTVGQSPVVL